jgi:hypothetical protein|nr:hypothetical protein [uncultured Rhodopila sp.]
MNLKVIDAWDVQSEGTSWDEARCSAKVTLNTGPDRVLDYRLVPRHGSYFIVTQLR